MSYDQLITEALLNGTDRMLTLKDVYLTIAAKHPFYKIETPSWKNCIRHNLSLNKNFIKLSNDKGSFWMLKSGAESILLAKPDKKSARKVKGSQKTVNPSGVAASQGPKKGLTDARSAVGFCLGSGLFGSYNSD